MATEPCRNCGEPAGPQYCGRCGQELRETRGPILDMLRDGLAEWFALDGRLLRTLRALLLPGKLAVEYLAGHRAAYLRPVRLYTIASLALFSSALSLSTPDATMASLTIDRHQVTAAPARAGVTSYSIDTKDSWLMTWLTGGTDRLLEMPPQDIVDAVFAGLRRVLPLALVLFVMRV